MSAFRNITAAVLAAGLFAVPAAAPAQEASPEAALAEIAATFGKVPAFLERYPRAALPGAWQVMKVLGSGETALEPKVKELVSLAVAAQIPCAYCVWAHTEAARVSGASEEEISETVALAAQVRHWSTVAHGLQIDLEDFKTEMETALSANK